MKPINKSSVVQADDIVSVATEVLCGSTNGKEGTIIMTVEEG